MRFLTLCALLVVGCGGHSDDIAYTQGRAFGTTYEIQIANSRVKLHQVKIGVENILSQIDQGISNYNPKSEVSRFNESGAQWYDVSEPTYDLIAQSMEIAEWTQGAFDPTVTNLVDLWGFYRLNPQQSVPTKIQIDRRLSATGYQTVLFDPESRRIRKTYPEIQLDLSAIGKGYAVDRIATYLRSIEVEHFLIEIGGEISVQGTKPTGNPWTVGIQDPTNPASILAVVELPSAHGMATSGNYRNFFESKGKRYSHLIDPRTGASQQGPTSSVTVVHEHAAVADALATALMVMPWQESLSWAENANIASLFVLNQGDKRVHATKQMQPYLQKKAADLRRETAAIDGALTHGDTAVGK